MPTAVRDKQRTSGGNLAALIRQEREKCGLAQTDLSVRAGVSRSRIIAAEAGTSLPTMEVCLRLARALGVAPRAMIRAFVNDSVAEAAPDTLAELGAEFLEGRSHWDTVADHHGLSIGAVEIQGRVNQDGDLAVARRLTGCVATRPRRRLVFRDRVVGEKAPSFAIKGTPRGLGYSMHVAIVGEWVLHHVEFRRPWEAADGPFNIEIDTLMPGAFVLELEQFHRRLASEGLSSPREARSDFRHPVVHAAKKLTLGISLPRSYEPPWLTPTATWGSAPIEDYDWLELDRRSCAASSFRAAKNEAELVLDRPVPGFAFGIGWTPLSREGGKGK
jgi:transcriptional regulator with XRE-family HTH domain